MVRGGSPACDGLRAEYIGVGVVSRAPSGAVGHTVFDEHYRRHSLGADLGAFQRQEPVISGGCGARPKTAGTGRQTPSA